MKQNRMAIREPDIFDILSAAWILASNDENPIMTYEGITQRLNLPKEFDVRKLIQCRGELFRRGVSYYRLREWKQQMLEGKHLPSWIEDIEDETARKKRIQSLSYDDVFRSQFRAQRDAPRSEVQIIEWGLQHIDRLRKANVEAQEQTAKSWQMWLLFAVSILNTALAVGAALFK